MSVKVVTILGARPQFIKAAPVSRRLRERANVTEIIVHTGQHYDRDMSAIFFSELGIPEPDYNLAIAGGNHGQMTGRQLEKIEAVLLKERPDWVVVYGDTNSTLAGALAAAKLNLPLAHVEAGLRSFNRSMPEEINRIVTDHISTVLFTPTDTATNNLRNEGISVESIVQTGDVMMDACLMFRDKARPPDSDKLVGVKAGAFVLATLHRAENTEDRQRLQSVMKGLGSIEFPIIMPLHPRTTKALKTYKVTIPQNVMLLPPIGYLEMLWLTEHAHCVATDSGGLQKEAYFLHTPCLTLRNETEWVELVDLGVNSVVGTDCAAISAALDKVVPKDAFTGQMPYGQGQCADRIVERLATLT